VNGAIVPHLRPRELPMSAKEDPLAGWLPTSSRRDVAPACGVQFLGIDIGHWLQNACSGLVGLALEEAFKRAATDVSQDFLKKAVTSAGADSASYSTPTLSTMIREQLT